MSGFCFLVTEGLPFSALIEKVRIPRPKAAPSLLSEGNEEPSSQAFHFPASRVSLRSDRNLFFVTFFPEVSLPT